MNLYRPFSVSSGSNAPYMRGFWSYERATWATLFCLIPPLVATLWENGGALFPALVLSVITVVGWQALFVARRKIPQRRGVLVSAVIFVVIAGSDVPLFPAVLGLSFGIILGELVFGGRGFSFLNPVVVALAFIIFAYPTITFSSPAVWLTYASIPGAVFLIVSRLVSWRMLAGFVVSLIATSSLFGAVIDLGSLTQGYFLFIVIFLACDPATSACTNSGRWANGILSGFLVCVFTGSGGAANEVQPLIMAIFLGSIFAPLIDRIVVEINVFMRSRRNG